MGRYTNQLILSPWYQPIRKLHVLLTTSVKIILNLTEEISDPITKVAVTEKYLENMIKNIIDYNQYYSYISQWSVKWHPDQKWKNTSHWFQGKKLRELVIEYKFIWVLWLINNFYSIKSSDTMINNYKISVVNTEEIYQWERYFIPYSWESKLYSMKYYG